MHVIGITGTLWAGKWTIVEYLQEKYGFKHKSVRKFLQEEMERRWLPNNRDSMTLVANDLRKTYWSSYIIEALYKEAEATGENTIIESIRAIGEIQALQKKSLFTLFAVDADIKTRYERIKKRWNESDNVSFEKFVEDEKREMNNEDPTKQNIAACIKMADYTFTNNSTEEDLKKQIDLVMKEIQ